MVCTATLTALLLAGCGAAAEPSARHQANSFQTVALDLGFARGLELQDSVACMPTSQRREGRAVPPGFSAREAESYRKGMELGLAQARATQGRCVGAPLPGRQASRVAAARTAYCVQGGRLAQGAADYQTQVQAVAENCRSGDTVSLPIEASDLIATVCDMSRPIASAGKTAFCTIGAIRPLRAPPSVQPWSRRSVL